MFVTISHYYSSLKTIKANNLLKLHEKIQMVIFSIFLFIYTSSKKNLKPATTWCFLMHHSSVYIVIHSLLPTHIVVFTDLLSRLEQIGSDSGHRNVLKDQLFSHVNPAVLDLFTNK